MSKYIKKYLLVIIACSVVILNTGCSSNGDVEGRSFELDSVVKNDIDLVSETHQLIVFDALEELAVKLYKRNPHEWKKEDHESLEMAVEAITGDPFPDVDGKKGVESIRLTFDEEYQGDRVKTFIVGLETMVLASYDNHRSFFLYT